MNLIGIDFEDWYHPQFVQPFVKNLKHEPKMFQGLEKIIELLRKLILPQHSSLLVNY